MKLYYHPLSTFSRRVRMQLLEKGVTIDEVSVDMAKREHRAETYRALNPYQRVPVLVDGDFVLFESSAIMEYLESVFPVPPLMPADAKGRALVSMHVKLCDLELSSHTRALFFPRRFAQRERWDLPAQTAAIDAIARHLGVLEQQLEGREYLVGNVYSLVEVAYTPFVEMLPLIELTPQGNVQAWIERLARRPSAIATRPPDLQSAR